LQELDSGEAGTSRLVSMEYIKMVLIYKFTGGARRLISLMKIRFDNSMGYDKTMKWVAVL